MSTIELSLFPMKLDPETGDGRLWGEYDTFMEMVREARTIHARIRADYLKQVSAYSVTTASPTSPG